MTLTKYAQEGRPPENCLTLFGFQLDPRYPQQIIYVLPNSPAEAAGISAGDKILAIDNVPIDKMGFFDIDRSLNQLREKHILLLIQKSFGEQIRVKLSRSDSTQ